MANLRNAYDANAEAQQDFGAIPTGEYMAVITESDMKQTKAGNGEYLELTHEITEGQFKGRKVWARLNLKSANQQAQEIANRQFASIREATGVANPEDSQELHYKPMVIRVEFTPAGTQQKNGYVTDRDSNDIKAWKKATGAATTTTQSNAGSSPFAAKTDASGKPSWAKAA